MKIYQKGTFAWQEKESVTLPINELIARYESGYAGCYLDTEEYDKFTELSRSTGGYSEVEAAAQAFGWADAFAGQLVIPFIHVMEQFPGAWPGPAQGRGDCVSHSDKNAKLGTMVGDVVANTPDEVSGHLEALPEIGTTGVKNGAFSTEAVYWYRNHSGDGWFCGAAANISMSKCGGVIRKNYPEIGIDLTKYSAAIAGKWGGTEPPPEITKVLNRNLIRTAARASTFEASRDALGQGRFLSTCGGEGFSNTRDANGVSRRSGTWAHAMAEIGADDREETKKLYGGPLALVLNSWGAWNNGPRDIRDSAKYVPADKKDLWIKLDIVNPQTGNIMIPKGAFWARWNDWKQRERLVYAGFNGWKRQKIENWGLSLWG